LFIWVVLNNRSLELFC